MSVAEKFETRGEGWDLAQRLLGSIFSSIRLGIENKPKDLRSTIANARNVLMHRFGKIAVRMADNGHMDDSENILDVRSMIVEGDLANPLVLDAIHEKCDGYLNCRAAE